MNDERVSFVFLFFFCSFYYCKMELENEEMESEENHCNHPRQPYLRKMRRANAFSLSFNLDPNVAYKRFCRF